MKKKKEEKNKRRRIKNPTALGLEENSIANGNGEWFGDFLVWTVIDLWATKWRRKKRLIKYLNPTDF